MLSQPCTTIATLPSQIDLMGISIGTVESSVKTLSSNFDSKIDNLSADVSAITDAMFSAFTNMVRKPLSVWMK
jgi:flagellin-like hook-associated protein FlgL